MAVAVRDDPGVERRFVANATTLPLVLLVPPPPVAALPPPPPECSNEEFLFPISRNTGVRGKVVNPVTVEV